MYYHPRNAVMTMYGDCWQLRLLAFMGKALGIQFRVDGFPYGAPFDRERFEAHHSRMNRGQGAIAEQVFDTFTGAPVQLPLGGGHLGSVSRGPHHNAT